MFVLLFIIITRYYLYIFQFLKAAIRLVFRETLQKHLQKVS